MKALLATSPHVRHAAVLQSDFTPDRSVMYSFAPVGLLSLAAVLRRDRPDITCEIYDLNRRILSGALPLSREFYAKAAADICAWSPDVVGFMTECDSYHHLLQIAEAIKEFSPDCVVVLGGPHASVVARPTLSRCNFIDAVVVGEGEVTFPELLDWARERSQPPPLGTVVRTLAGEILDGGNRPLVEHLDELPPPAYDLYRPDPGEEIFIEVGRGCPFKCEFCSTAPYWRRRHRVKSPARVVKEVLWVRDLFGTARAHFTHDLFTTDRTWVEAVCAELIRAGVPMRWTCSARTDTVDDGLLALMAQAGCSAIYFGIESGSEQILRTIRKEIPLSQSFAMIDACRHHGITPNAGFIAGFPSETTQTLRETFAGYERALRAGCRPTHLFAFCPFAGSSMYPGLSGLTCTGHFVDIPLGPETDIENRRRVAHDPVLYGAYFRPNLPDLVPGEPDAVPALDEFSPLVEAALAPALALSELRGGMYEVFRRWLRWVHARNDARGAAAYRRGYGTAAAFATFLLDELSELPETPPATLAAARAVQVNLCVAEAAVPVASTTMASHRSLVLPEYDGTPEISLGTPLSAGDVVASLSLDYDVTPVLQGRVDVEPIAEPTYLIWQRTPNAGVRLVRTDRVIFDALSLLKDKPRSPGELYLMRLDRNAGRDHGDAPEFDAQELLDSLTRAAREGLLTVGDQ